MMKILFLRFKKTYKDEKRIYEGKTFKIMVFDKLEVDVNPTVL